MRLRLESMFLLRNLKLFTWKLYHGCSNKPYFLCGARSNLPQGNVRENRTHLHGYMLWRSYLYHETELSFRKWGCCIRWGIWPFKNNCLLRNTVLACSDYPYLEVYYEVLNCWYCYILFLLYGSSIWCCSLLLSRLLDLKNAISGCIRSVHCLWKRTSLLGCHPCSYKSNEANNCCEGCYCNYNPDLPFFHVWYFPLRRIGGHPLYLRSCPHHCRKYAQHPIKS